MPRDGSKNLIPLNKRSKEEQDEIRRKASATKRARAEARRAFRELMEEESNELVQNNKTGEYITKRRLIGKKVVEGALSGDPQKVKLWADLSGVSTKTVELTGKDGKDLIPQDLNECLAELAALREKTGDIEGDAGGDK